MIRISHTVVEVLRRDPTALARLSAREFSGPSRFMYVKWATRKYHKDGLQSAIEYLETRFLARNFRMESFESYANYLVGYDRTFRARGAKAVQFGERIEIPASPEVVVGGEVSRIDIELDGYAAWLFCEDLDGQWRRQLRMPLIQHFVADLMGAPLDEVVIGFYCFREEVYDQEQYAASAVRRAERELGRLARQISGV